MADPGHHDRHHRRARGRRLLRRPGIRRPIPARLSRRLPRPATQGRRRRPGFGRLHQAVGDPAGRIRRRAGVSAAGGQVRARSRRARHRQRDRGGAHRPAGDPGPRDRREDHRQRADHRLGRIRRPRGTGRTDLRRLRLAADPPAQPLRRGRPHRGVARHRLGDRRDLRRTAGRRGAGRVDRVPRRLRLPGADPGLHHVGDRLRRVRFDPRLGPDVR